MIETALCLLLFMAIVTGFGQLAVAVWIKTTLHHAVREGSRYAITGATRTGLGHVDSIKKIVQLNSAGLIQDGAQGTAVQVEFRDSAGAAAAGPGANAGGNTVVLKVVDYPIPTIISPLISWVPGGLKVSAASVGRLEPYTVPPAL